MFDFDYVHHSFDFIINDLQTEEEVLNWYLEMNSGGTVHTKEELDKVKHLLEEVQSKTEVSKEPVKTDTSLDEEDIER